MTRASADPTRPTGGWGRALQGRIRLAQSILGHRPWCERCERHARQAEAALRGESMETITRMGK
jgi:hypothetical protein